MPSKKGGTHCKFREARFSSSLSPCGRELEKGVQAVQSRMTGLLQHISEAGVFWKELRAVLVNHRVAVVVGSVAGLGGASAHGGVKVVTVADRGYVAHD